MAKGKTKISVKAKSKPNRTAHNTLIEKGITVKMQSKEKAKK